MCSGRRFNAGRQDELVDHCRASYCYILPAFARLALRVYCLSGPTSLASHSIVFIQCVFDVFTVGLLMLVLGIRYLKVSSHVTFFPDLSSSRLNSVL